VVRLASLRTRGIPLAVRLNRLWTTVDGAIADLGDSSRDRRANAGAWVWRRGYDGFSAEERRRLAEALLPVAEADADPAARAALGDPDWGMRTIVASEVGPAGDPRVVDALLDLLKRASSTGRRQ